MNIERINKEGVRYYKYNDKEDLYPSVTSILNYYPKSQGFINWLVNNPNSEQLKNSAGIQGGKVHKAIEKTISLEEPNINDFTFEEKKSFSLFLDWWKDLNEKNNVEVIDSEVMAINEQDKYGGTIDLILKINDQIYLIDFKTSNYIHTTHILQLSAYKHTLKYDNVKLMIVHINNKKDSYQSYEINDYYDLFLSIKNIFTFETNKIIYKELNL